MAFDLQLHQPSRQGTNSGARNSIVAQQEQNRAVWACYVLDKCVSLMLGRPVMLRRADIVRVISRPIFKTLQLTVFALT